MGADPEIRIAVGDKTFDEIASLIAQRGIKLEPLTKFTSENFPGAGNEYGQGDDYVDITGMISFKGELIPFTLNNIKGKEGVLKVDVGYQRAGVAIELVDILDDIFRTGTQRRSRAISTASKAVSERIPWGCFLFILIIAACLFFFGYGIYAFVTRQIYGG